jgi:hypothetical protein
MSISPDLFNSVQPPSVWVTLGGLESAEHDERLVTLRVQAVGSRSVSASVPISRYSPEHTIMRAMADVMMSLEAAQAPVGREKLQELMVHSIQLYVDPF